ncbi:MAG: response regulator [Candidatus Kariarchaeaceae archaeon]
MIETNLKILFVEDEPDLQKVIQLSLDYMKDINYEITGSAEKAIEYLKNNQVDVIVSDHYLPKMTGVELLVHVKEKYPNVMRFLLTGSVENDVFDAAERKAKPIKIFEKPLILEDIINDIKEISAKLS